MATRLSDSLQYAHLWGSSEMALIFEEERRLQSWLDILVALARVQARHGVIPEQAVAAIAESARADRLDLDYVAAETRRTSHSMLGLIHGLERVLGEDAAQYVYVGATVQDVTDTWFGLVMRDAGAIVRRGLRVVEAALLTLAERIDAYHDPDLENSNDRVIFYQKYVEAGLRASINDKFTILGALGYTFGQDFRYGFDTRDDHEITKIQDGPYVRLEGQFRF